MRISTDPAPRPVEDASARIRAVVVAMAIGVASMGAITVVAFGTSMLTGMMSGWSTPPPAETTPFTVSELQGPGQSPVDPRDLDAIVESGVLRVGLPADSTSWFVDQKRFRGFEHDILKAYARGKGLRLELVPIDGVEERLQRLASGELDVVAGRLGMFEQPGVTLHPVHPVLYQVVQSVERVQSGQEIDSLDDLVDARRIEVVRGSGAEAAVAALDLALLGTASIVTLPDGRSLEDAVRHRSMEDGVLVAREDLVAPLLDTPGIAAGPVLPGSGYATFATRSGAVSLGVSLDNWLAANPDVVEWAADTYLSKRYQPRSVRVSDYDRAFRTATRPEDWDWTWLAAVSWQESRFNPGAVSGAGAQGLMQLMPATAAELGVDPSDPYAAVQGAGRYLRKLDRYYARIDQRSRAGVPDSPPHWTGPRRVPFVLAAYNAGMGHVDDAMRLTHAEGDDPFEWDAVSARLLRLSDRETLQHEVVRNGYCRGAEPVEYVRSVRGRQAIYAALVTSAGDD